MPLYDWVCPYCEDEFEARVDVEQRNEPLECPFCGAGAFRKFTPRSINFNLAFDEDRTHGGTSFELTENERCLLSIDPALHHDVNHTANYYLGKKRDERQQKVDEFFRKQKPRKSITERMREKYPEMQLEGTVGKASAEYLRKSTGAA